MMTVYSSILISHKSKMFLSLPSATIVQCFFVYTGGDCFVTGIISHICPLDLDEEKEADLDLDEDKDLETVERAI